jgi:hypothetical protein
VRLAKELLQEEVENEKLRLQVVVLDVVVETLVVMIVVIAVVVVIYIGDNTEALLIQCQSVTIGIPPAASAVG